MKGDTYDGPHKKHHRVIHRPKFKETSTGDRGRTWPLNSLLRWLNSSGVVRSLDAIRNYLYGRSFLGSADETTKYVQKPKTEIGSVDLRQVYNLVGEVLIRLGDKYYSHEAQRLVYLTGLVESDGYRYIRQLGGGPARGFWQIEPTTAVDNCRTFIRGREQLRIGCMKATYVPLIHWTTPDHAHWNDILEMNMAAGIVHCRIKYWRAPDPLPITLNDISDYWKRFFNTHKGAGTPEHFKAIVAKYEGVENV